MLFNSIKLGDLTLSNRIAMAPMTRSRADAAGMVGDLHSTYYSQRATAGLIISEAINISADALGSPMTPGLFNAGQIAAWRKVTDAVHAAGGRIFAQLWHTGRVGHSSVRGGALPVAPSSIAIKGQQHFTPTGPQDYEVPRAMSLAEVKAAIADYGTAAQAAKDAGFDGVELHAAFGYLPNQFLVDGANTRTDEYGGSIENRCRFTLEAMAALVGVWGEDRVGIKLSPSIPFNSMIDSDPTALFSHLIGKLDEMPLAYLHLMQAMFPLDAFPSWPKDPLVTFGPLYHGTVMTNGGYSQASAEAVLQSGHAQIVSFGAKYVSNPDLVARFAKGAALAEPDRATMYGGGAKGLIDYPAMAG
jgi:N-ethylmaleimide reductase